MYEDGYKDLMDEGGTYGVSGVLIDEMLVFTVALYTMFFFREFPSRGHVSLSLQLVQWMESIILLWLFMI